MGSSHSIRTGYGSTALFVLLWSSGAIVARVSLDYAAAFAVLASRFVLALAALGVICACRRRWLPPHGSRMRVAIAGALLIGGYPICYLLALDRGLTPGVLASIMGVQPILTLLLVERHYSRWRMLGLIMALGGLLLVVQPRAAGDVFPLTGVLFACAALASMTSGSIVQKGIDQAPADVLPLQYVISLLVCALFLPFQPLHVDWGIGFVASVTWLALVISVGAQLLLYHLIRAGNLVSVTSVFYLVPPTTSVMDYVLLGNALSAAGIAGTAMVVIGLIVALRATRTRG